MGAGSGLGAPCPGEAGGPVVLRGSLTLCGAVCPERLSVLLGAVAVAQWPFGVPVAPSWTLI